MNPNNPHNYVKVVECQNKSIAIGINKKSASKDALWFKLKCYYLDSDFAQESFSPTVLLKINVPD